MLSPGNDTCCTPRCVMVFAIGCFGCTCCTDWICGLEVASEASHWCRRCVHALVQELRTLLLAAGENLAAKRRDGRNAASRREHVFTPSQHGFHAATGACELRICRATLLFFTCSSTLIDSAADSMNLEVVPVSLVFKNVRTPTTCLGRPRLYNCEVMFAGLSQEHITDNETNTQFPVLQCGEPLGISTIICARLW